MFGVMKVLAITGLVALARAHTQITFPGERGDNLHSNGTLPQSDPENIGINYDKDGNPTFPWGMQWMYPCGGMPLSTNRTKWPYQGGAISIQPGWFPGHLKAFFYINMGITAPGDLAPPNMSHPLVPPFQILGPSNEEYQGQFCLPQVPMPVNVSLSVGDNVTLQVVEAAVHGAALYNCVDVTLAEPEDCAEVTPQNCYNSSNIGFELVFTSAALTSAAPSAIPSPSILPILAVACITAISAVLM